MFGFLGRDFQNLLGITLIQFGFFNLLLALWPANDLLHPEAAHVL